MATLEYFIVAESVSVDQITNRVSIFNVLEEVHPPKLPFAISKLVAVCLWIAEEGDEDRDFQVAFTFTQPDDEKKVWYQNFRIPGRRHRTIATFDGIPLSRAGTLRLDVELNQEHKASHVVNIFDPEAK